MIFLIAVTQFLQSWEESVLSLYVLVFVTNLKFESLLYK